MCKTTALTTALMAAAITAGSTDAAVLTVQGVTGHNGGNWPATLGHLSDMVNANGSNTLGTGDHNPGIDTSADPNDPSTWVNSSGSWQTEWLASSLLDTNTSLNGKIGWAVFDFGSVVANLDNMYLWNNRNSVDGEETKDYNVYYSSGAGIDALPAMPNSQSNAGDYDFSSGDWTQLGSTNTLSTAANPYGPDATLGMGGVSAQYVGIEILSLHDSQEDRVGLAQVEFTVIPEPSSLALLGLGGLLVARRRRR